ncbi:MAG: hypothetical protein HY584_03085 [Candidatus Omnitrophica bacterium]|nr:hypothetical protein [Candidatus Omnitrophota bacterium]
MRIVSAENLNFRVAKDRPLEKVAGMIAPIPLDAYFYQKFQEQEAHLSTWLEQFDMRLGRVEQLILDLRKMVLESKSKDSEYEK